MMSQRSGCITSTPPFLRGGTITAPAQKEDDMTLQPMTPREARRFVNDNHRHHKAPQGGLFAIGLSDGETVIGVAIVGRPVARMLDTGWTAEITRLCVLEGHKDGCSKLYSACWQAARAMGYQRLITYILKSETGVSVTAAGFRLVGECGGGTWNRIGRPRVDTHPAEQKQLFERMT